MDQLLHRLPAHAEAIGGARREVRSWLDRIDADQEVAEELVVVASELCAHLISRSATGEITMRGWADESAVSIEVVAEEPRVAAIPFVRKVIDPLAPGQPGRLVVERLCDQLETRVTGQLRAVRCVRTRWSSRLAKGITPLDR